MFRAEIHICGDTPSAQRHHVARVLRRMADQVVLSAETPLAGSAQITISEAGQVQGEGWFEASLLRRVVA
jgi:hypothetical protein